MRSCPAFFVLSIVALLAGCATAPKPDIWPPIYSDETYLESFDSTWPPDEAMATIRNLETSLVEYSAGVPLSELSVDQYGLRARWTWLVKPSGPQSAPIQQSASFIIAFNQVGSLLLEHYPNLNVDFRWGLIVRFADGTAVSVRCPTREAAMRFGSAVSVLARARGAEPSLPNPRLGAALSALSAAQSEAAGLAPGTGAIVLWLFREGPAEKVGLSPQDIFVAVDGEKVAAPDAVFASIEAAATAGKPEVVLSVIRRSYRVEGLRHTEIFVPMTVAIALEKPGD